VQRLTGRKVDPVTGNNYAANDILSLDQATQDRLVEIPNNATDVIQKRLARWKELLKSVEEKYSRFILKINSNLSEKNVLEKVSYHLENS